MAAILRRRLLPKQLAIGHHLLASVLSHWDGVLFLFVASGEEAKRFLGAKERKRFSVSSPLLSPSDIRANVRAFFLVVGYGLFKTDPVRHKTKCIAKVGCIALFLLFVATGCQRSRNEQARTAASASTDSAAKRTATPPVAEKNKRVNEAFAKSKRLLKGYQYEAAVETLRAVKTLAPDKVLPQIATVKRAGAKGLTQTAKEIRPKNPGLALEMLNRAAAFGGEEASRLIPRVRRDIAAREAQVQAQARVGEEVAAYIEQAETLSVTMGESVSEFGGKFAEIKDEPLLLRDQTWRLRTAGHAASVKMTCEKIRALKTPETCSGAQDKLLTISRETEKYIDLMLEAVDSVDVNTINSATRHLNRGTAEIPAFRDELTRLKRKYQMD